MDGQFNGMLFKVDNRFLTCENGPIAVHKIANGITTLCWYVLQNGQSVQWYVMPSGRSISHV
eukprot:3856810-Karenia_brevis.AAC.1